MKHFEEFFLVKNYSLFELKEGLNQESVSNLLTYGTQLIGYLNEITNNEDKVDIVDFIRAENDLPMVKDKMRNLKLTLAHLQKFEIMSYKGVESAIFVN